MVSSTFPSSLPPSPVCFLFEQQVRTYVEDLGRGGRTKENVHPGREREPSKLVGLDAGRWRGGEIKAMPKRDRDGCLVA